MTQCFYRIFLRPAEVGLSALRPRKLWLQFTLWFCRGRLRILDGFKTRLPSCFLPIRSLVLPSTRCSRCRGSLKVPYKSAESLCQGHSLFYPAQNTKGRQHCVFLVNNCWHETNKIYQGYGYNISKLLLGLIIPIKLNTMLLNLFVVFLRLHGPFEASFYEITFGWPFWELSSKLLDILFVSCQQLLITNTQYGVPVVIHKASAFPIRNSDLYYLPSEMTVKLLLRLHRSVIGQLQSSSM